MKGYFYDKVHVIEPTLSGFCDLPFVLSSVSLSFVFEVLSFPELVSDISLEDEEGMAGSEGRRAAYGGWWESGGKTGRRLGGRAAADGTNESVRGNQQQQQQQQRGERRSEAAAVRQVQQQESSSRQRGLSFEATSPPAPPVYTLTEHYRNGHLLR